MSEEQKQKARERAKKYYQKNKEKILARQKEYIKNKLQNDDGYRQKVRERAKRYRENNKEKYKEYFRKAQKEYYQRHKEQIKESNRQWYLHHESSYKGQKKKIIQLKNRIAKVIEYIEDRIEDINNGGNEYEYRSIEHIKEMLKGEDK